MSPDSADSPVLAREADLRTAMLAGDVATLDALLDDALVFAGPDGAVVGKQDDLDAHRARRLRLTRLDPSDRHVVRCGATAVVSVRMDLVGTYDGVDVSGAYRYTRVWCECPEGWRVVGGHMSVIPG